MPLVAHINEAILLKMSSIWRQKQKDCHKKEGRKGGKEKKKEKNRMQKYCWDSSKELLLTQNRATDDFQPGFLKMKEK